MKITVIGINYEPEVTGVAPYTTGIAEGLAERGHEVFVLTALPHYPEWRVPERYRDRSLWTETRHGVRIRRVKHFVPRTPGAVGRVRMEASFARAVLSRDWRQPSVVITVSPALLAAAGVVVGARVRRVPVGVIVQDVYSKGVVETGAMSGRAAAVTARLEGGTLRAATGVCVIHGRFADALVGLGVSRSKITTVRNWSHIDAPNPAPDITAARSQLGWRPDELVVVHAGNMGVKQGLENVVEAARLVGSRIPRVRFVLIGDGNQRRTLQDAAQGVSAVQFISPLPHQQFQDALNAADLLLVNERPGVGEMAVPSKLTSYFISGKAVLAATDPDSGTADEINASRAGVVVQPGDPQALLDAALDLANNREGAAEMGRAGQRYAREMLDRHRAIDRYEGWCEQLLTVDRQDAT